MSRGEAILRLKLDHDNEAGAVTIEGYFRALLHNLIVEKEGFSGKRPFGNSGWEYDLYWALIRGGYSVGTLDSEGYVADVDSRAADALLLEALMELDS